MTPDTGLLKGTPMRAGTYTGITIGVMDEKGNKEEFTTLSMTVNAQTPPTYGGSNLKDVVVKKQKVDSDTDLITNLSGEFTDASSDVFTI